MGVIFGVILEYLGFLGLGGSLRRFVLFPQPDFGEMRAEYCFLFNFVVPKKIFKIIQKILKITQKLFPVAKNTQQLLKTLLGCAGVRRTIQNKLLEGGVCGGRYKINYSAGGLRIWITRGLYFPQTPL